MCVGGGGMLRSFVGESCHLPDSFVRSVLREGRFGIFFGEWEYSNGSSAEHYVLFRRIKVALQF